MTLPGPSGRVVVTGYGAVTPLGTGVEAFWPRMVAGETGGGRITLMDPTGYATTIAAEVKDFDPEDWLDKKDARRVDRFMAFSAAGARMALDHAGFPDDDEVRLETGVLIGSGIGGLETMGEQTKKLHLEGPSRVSPFWVPYIIPDMASGYVSILNKLKGPNTCIVSACSTGADAIGTAFRMIQRGDAVAMLAGGAEAPINPIGIAAFSAARAMTTNNDNPTTASRPFDKDRDGFLIGEGAAVLMLEDLAFAQARGATIHAEVVGYGMSADAHHITAPDPDGDGAVRSMTKALRHAEARPEDVTYVNAHGTSTPLNDRTETHALKRVLGDHAYRIPISSTKSMIGHTLGAAGAIEALVCILAMRDQLAPPTINYTTPDPDCDLDYVPNTARPAPIGLCLTNSFGFGGHNVTLALRPYTRA